MTDPSGTDEARDSALGDRPDDSRQVEVAPASTRGEEVAETVNSPVELVSEDSDDAEELERAPSRGSERPDIPPSINELLVQLDNSGYQPKLVGADRYLSFELPAGRSTRRVVLDEVAAEALIDTDLSSWRSLERYDGFWNGAAGIVEVALRGMGSVAPLRYQLARLGGGNGTGRLDLDRPSPVEFVDDSTEVSIRIGDSSGMIAALMGGRSAQMRGRVGDIRGPVTMRIGSVGVSTTAEADAIVERLVDSISFDLSLRTGITIVAQRLESRERRRPARLPNRGTPAFPKNSYPHGAVALYQSGLDRTNSPLIRYWAFYQVLEYFFPRFSQSEAVRQLARHLRSPSFDPHDDEDVLRAVELTVPVSKGSGSEEDQLKITLRAVVTPREVEEFINNNGLNEQLEDKKSELSQKLVRASTGNDVLAQLGERIYDIRCKIVHSKSGSLRGVGPGLLPGTYHDDLVRGELLMMEFLAQQALLATADRLSIPRKPS